MFDLNIYNLDNDPYKNMIPQSLMPFLDQLSLEINNNYVYCFTEKTTNELAFIVRLYYLNKNIKKNKNINNSNIKYELGDVWLNPKYRSKLYNQINKTYAKYFLEIVIDNFYKNIVSLKSFNSKKPYLFLWTTKNNIPAIKTYKKFGFTFMQKYNTMNKIKMDKWIFTVYSKYPNNDWIIGNDIVYMTL